MGRLRPAMTGPADEPGAGMSGGTPHSFPLQRGTQIARRGAKVTERRDTDGPETQAASLAISGRRHGDILPAVADAKADVHFVGFPGRPHPS